MPQGRVQRVQDTIHGLMEFFGMETSVVDVLRAKELQRLRRIRQLGLAHLVFPGAEHSRLVHCLGTAHLAIRFANQLRHTTRDVLVSFLRPSATSTRDFALAALCHDLGHGPLSHQWEHVIMANFDRDAWCRSLGLPPEPRLAKMKWHELVGQGLLAWPDGDLHRILEAQEEGTAERVRGMLAGDYYLPYLPLLLSGDIDVDRCDFILRDATLSGVAYGRYDLDWLISTATVGIRNRQPIVGFDIRKGPRVIEQFLIARKAMYQTVYYHKTVKAAEAMVGLLLQRLQKVIRDKPWPYPEIRLFDSIIKVLRGEALQPHEVLGLDDSAVWALIHILAENPEYDVTAADLANRLLARDLFKSVDYPDDFFRNRAAHDELERRVATYFPNDPQAYLYVESAEFRVLTKRDEDASVFVASDGSTTPISVHPEFKQYSNQKESARRIFVPREAAAAVREYISKSDR